VFSPSLVPSLSKLHLGDSLAALLRPRRPAAHPPGGGTDGARLVEIALLMGLFFVVWLVLEYLRIGSRPARLVRAVASPGPAQPGSEGGR